MNLESFKKHMNIIQLICVKRNLSLFDHKRRYLERFGRFFIIFKIHNRELLSFILFLQSMFFMKSVGISDTQYLRLVSVIDHSSKTPHTTITSTSRISTLYLKIIV